MADSPWRHARFPSWLLIWLACCSNAAGAGGPDASDQRSVWSRLPPEARLQLAFLLAAIVVLGAALIWFILTFGRLLRLYSSSPRTDRRATGFHRDADDWARKRLVPTSREPTENGDDNDGDSGDNNDDDEQQSNGN